jgi:hypothetical protein
MRTYAIYIYVQLLRWCPSLDQMHTVFNPNADVIYGVLRYSLYALLTYADVCGRMLCIRHLRRPPVLSLRFTSTKVQILTQQLLRWRAPLARSHACAQVLSLLAFLVQKYKFWHLRRWGSYFEEERSHARTHVRKYKHIFRTVDAVTYSDISTGMLMYADVCWRMLTYADVRQLLRYDHRYASL